MSQVLALLLNSCETIQEDLGAAFQIPQPNRESLPFLEFVGGNTPLNQTISPGEGKTRTVHLRYDVDIAESQVASNQENPRCTATTQRGDKIATYSIDTNANLQVEELVEVRDLEKICRSNPAYFASLVDRLIYALDRRIATVTAQQAAVLNGKWATDVAGVTSDRLVINTLKASSTDINPLAIADLDLALMQTGFASPVGFGGTTLYKYMRAIEAGCCATQGLNVAELLSLYGKAFMYDRRVAAALGGNDYNLFIQPNSFALLEYTVNGWADGLAAPYQSGAYYKTVVRSPRSGVAMDLTIKDDCGNVSLILTATTKLVAMPDDMYSVGDRYEGVKFVNEVLVTNT